MQNIKITCTKCGETDIVRTDNPGLIQRLELNDFEDLCHKCREYVIHQMKDNTSGIKTGADHE